MKRILLLIIAFLLPAIVHGQASRFDWNVQTINSSAPQPGGQYPVLAIPNSVVHVCAAPANAVPCTNYATTYTDATAGTSCPTNTQMTRPGTSTCVANADAEGGWGVWMASGNYQYTVTTLYGSFGPYDFSIGGSGGNPSVGTNGQIQMADGSGAFLAAPIDFGATTAGVTTITGTGVGQTSDIFDVIPAAYGNPLLSVSGYGSSNHGAVNAAGALSVDNFGLTLPQQSICDVIEPAFSVNNEVDCLTNNGGGSFTVGANVAANGAIFNSTYNASAITLGISASGSSTVSVKTASAINTAPTAVATFNSDGLILQNLTPGTSPPCPNGPGGALTQSGCSGGGGAVSSVSNSDSTLTVTPTTGAVVASLALGHANTWTATQTFPSASITNAELANNSITVSGVNIPLGGSGSPVTCGGSASPCYLQQINPTSGSTTTTSTITTGATSIPVASCASFTFAPGNIIAAYNVSPLEFLVGASCTGTTLTVSSRGYYGTTAIAWASGTTLIQMTRGSSLGASTYPYYYELATGAIGYLGAGNISANSVSYGGPAAFTANLTAAGTVLLEGGPSGTTLYTQQYATYHAANTATCETSGGYNQMHSGGNLGYWTGTMGVGCPAPNVWAIVPGTTSAPPGNSSVPVFTVSNAGIVNVPTGGNFEINGVPVGISGLITGYLPLATSTTTLGNSTLDYNVTNSGDFTFGAPVFMPSGSEMNGSPLCSFATGCGASAGVSTIIGPSSTVTGNITFTGAAVTQTGNTFSFSTGTCSGCFLLSPSGGQTITIPSGFGTSTVQVDTANTPVTQDDTQMFSYPAGWNNGAPFNGNSDWLTIAEHHVNEMCAHAGICQWTGGAFTHTGTGDTAWQYGYTTAWGGLTNGNDEGNEHIVGHIDEQGIAYGPTTSSGTALSLVNVPSPLCWSFGNGCSQRAYNSDEFPVGGFIFNSTTPGSTLTVSGVAGNVGGAIEYTLGSGTVTPSTAIGTITSCTTSVQGKIGVYGTQTCVVNVTLGSFVSSANIYHIGKFVEEDGSVTVTGSAPTQTITMQSQYPFNANEFIGQGGPGGEVLLDAAGAPYSAAYFIGGALDSTHLLFGNCLTGGCGSGGNIVAPDGTTNTPALSRVSNVVTASPYPFNMNVTDFPVGTSVVIAGYTPSDLNGTFTVVTNNYNNVSPVITWAQTGADENSSVVGTMTKPLPQITIYPAAAIVGTNNTCCGSANLATNHMTVSTSDVLVGAPTSEWKGTGIGIYGSQTAPANPGQPSTGIFFNDQGPTQFTYAFAAYNVVGHGPAKAMFNIQGSYGADFNIGYRPANNGVVILVGGGEPVSSNPKPYSLFADGASHLDIQVDPTANTFLFGSTGHSGLIADSIQAIDHASAFASGTKVNGTFNATSITTGSTPPSNCGSATGCYSGAQSSSSDTPTAGTWDIWMNSSGKMMNSVGTTSQYLGTPPLAGTTGTLTSTVLSSSCVVATVTVTGATVGHTVGVSSTTGADVGGAFNVRASVTSTNTVSVYLCGTGTSPALAFNVSTY